MNEKRFKNDSKSLKKVGFSKIIILVIFISKLSFSPLTKTDSKYAKYD